MVSLSYFYNFCYKFCNTTLNLCKIEKIIYWVSIPYFVPVSILPHLFRSFLYKKRSILAMMQASALPSTHPNLFPPSLRWLTGWSVYWCFKFYINGMILWVCFCRFSFPEHYTWDLPLIDGYGAKALAFSFFFLPPPPSLLLLLLLLP